MSSSRPINRRLDLLFRIGMVIKGIDSFFEVVGGVLLTQPIKVARYVSVLAEHELYRHHQVLSGRLDRLADTITTHTSIGGAAYLCVHGFAKLILIAAALRNLKWGYWGLIAVISVFTTIEFTRAVVAHEIVTGVLGLFDLFVVVVITKEYRSRYVTPLSDASKQD